MNESLNQTPTVGSLLRQNREDLGLTLRDLAAVTKIQSHMLQCLEEDRFEEFPAEVFCRGFLRSYARELRMDDAAVIELYLQQRGLTRNAIVVSSGNHRPATAKPAWTFLETGKLGRVAYVGAIAAVVVGLVLSMLVIGSPTNTTSTANLTPGALQQSPWSNTQPAPSDWRAYERN
jgi:cytoskeletal protein RodZ